MTGNRFVLLDAIRGLGVLGILLCNIPDFAAAPPTAESLPLWPYGHSPASTAVWLVTQVFFREKFVTLFSMLFGASIFLVGGERSNRQRGPIVVRRLIWLLVFGLVHGFVIWHGDILLDYAIAGLAVMWCRSWAPQRLLTVGICLFVVWIAFGFTMALAFLTRPVAAIHAGDAGDVAAAASAARDFSGSFLQSLHANVVARSIGPGEVINIIWGGALMLIGLGLFKLGVFTSSAARSVYFTLLAAGATSLMLMMMAATVLILMNGSPAALFWFGGIQYMFSPFISLGYVSMLTFAFRSRRWAALPRMLAPVGQMAFTNYLTQSLMMTALFYGGRGPDLFGRFDRPALAAIVVAVWVLQILWSRAWLQHFESGPFEWVWRRLYRGSTRQRAMPAADVVPA
ncbi:DUF418 domain-containing protein [uncultured Sphingomonas sp.]|uniref:DUF418 domain-containing protein n=1 Tax=uncultured Sphingomonas sp. TaxID=158754 RepID=UPI0035CA2064